MSCFFFFSSRRRHTRLQGDWSSDVCSSDLEELVQADRRTRRVALLEVLPLQHACDGHPGGQAHDVLERQLRQPLPVVAHLGLLEIGRACVGKECRSRWWTYHEK